VEANIGDEVFGCVSSWHRKDKSVTFAKIGNLCIVQISKSIA